MCCIDRLKSQAKADLRRAKGLAQKPANHFNNIEHRTLLLIRDFDEVAHLKGIQMCFIELQDFERSLDPRLPSGADIVDDYIPHMLNRCMECNGNVFVAELNEEVAGFATVFTKVKSDDIEDGDTEYGLVSDLVVASKFRRQGIGRKLLEAAESYAKSNEVSWLRIGVLAENHSAEGLYDSMGFKRLYIEREKKLPGQ